MAVQASLQASLPEGAVADPRQWAYELVPAALDAVLGEGAWGTEKRPKKGDPARNVTWVILTG
jgi:hypothetical protein